MAAVGRPLPATGAAATQAQVITKGGPAAAGGQAATRLKAVFYHGYRFEVPRSWPVISDWRNPTACVRFDVHAVYLGVPGVNQDCPSWLVGTTEALLIQPAPAATPRRSAENPIANQVTATAPSVEVTATFDTDPTVIYQILASAGLAAPVIVAPNPARLAAAQLPGPADAGGAAPGWVTADALSASQDRAAPALIFRVAAPELPATVANDVGLGFDVCAAPSTSTMRGWRQDSPYRAVGIYIGGADRACDQENLSSGWVRQEAAAGWRFMPMYVGPQASFGQLNDPARQGAAAAADAVQQAQRLGFGPRTPIYYDMEAYPPSQTSSALEFLSAWTAQLHALGYESGVYSSSDSGITNLASEYHSRRYAMPDVIYDALWNGSQNVSDPVFGHGEWTGRRRLHQFSGNVLQTYAGVTLDIDQDYLDLGLTAPGGTTQAAPAASLADSSRSFFYEGTDHQLWEDTRAASGTWSRTDLGGQLSSPPSVVQVGRSGLAVLYRSKAGELTVVRRSGSRWQAAEALPMMGIIGGAPRAVAQTNGVIDVFWSGHYDKHLWHGEYNPGQGWSGPQRLGGSLAGWPYPVESATGQVQVFWEGTDGRLWRVARGVGAGWTYPEDLGMGPMGGPPFAVQLPDGETDVFWRGKIPHSVWSAVITASRRVRGPTNLGGHVTGSPWPVVAAGREAVFFRGPHSELWEISRGAGGRWSAPARVGTIGRLGSAPVAASGGAGAPLTLFWIGPRSGLWSVSYTAGRGWQAPVNLGGRVK
ncbi:MAG TPA: glycoside hydrolase domain-containing protein [Streptosporangiaceae bacterium]|nr:glycoside hydrolase domain-containing protein [Streptosporangiaceae bacterium]